MSGSSDQQVRVIWNWCGTSRPLNAEQEKLPFFKFFKPSKAVWRLLPTDVTPQSSRYETEGEGDSYRIQNSINESTTVEDFKRLMERYPEWKFDYGGRCGWNVFGVAAKRCSPALLEWLLSQYPAGANLRGAMEMTPLCFLSWSDIGEKKCVPDDPIRYAKARILIEYGADPFVLCCIGEHLHPEHREQPITPYLLALQNRQDKLVKIYLDTLHSAPAASVPPRSSWSDPPTPAELSVMSNYSNRNPITENKDLEDCRNKNPFAV